jgi:hypothetical protein
VIVPVRSRPERAYAYCVPFLDALARIALDAGQPLLALDRVAEARAAHVPPGALAHRIALREAEARLARDDVAGARAALANVPREGGPEPTWRACLAASLGEAPADVADLRAALAAHPSAAERARAARCGR